MTMSDHRGYDQETAEALFLLLLLYHRNKCLCFGGKRLRYLQQTSSFCGRFVVQWFGFFFLPLRFFSEEKTVNLRQLLVTLIRDLHRRR
jgi:hypothetical protein